MARLDSHARFRCEISEGATDPNPMHFQLSTPDHSRPLDSSERESADRAIFELSDLTDRKSPADVLGLTGGCCGAKKGACHD